MTNDVITISVHPVYRPHRATQYLGQPNFPNTELCILEEGKLIPVAGTGKATGKVELGYRINPTTIVPIKHGDWIISPPKGLPLPETVVIGDGAFQMGYVRARVA